MYGVLMAIKGYYSAHRANLAGINVFGFHSLMTSDETFIRDKYIHSIIRVCLGNEITLT